MIKIDLTLARIDIYHLMETRAELINYNGIGELGTFYDGCRFKKCETKRKKKKKYAINFSPISF